MMSAETIRQMSAEAARKAARAKKVPYIVEQHDIDVWQYQLAHGGLRLPFPDIGDYRPKGYELIDHFMVDSSGWGAESEPAYTIRGLLFDRLKVGKAYAIIEVGQFQVVLGEFDVKTAVKS